MSLKPMKVSDLAKNQKRINEKLQRKKKLLLDDLPPYTVIVSEGVKTEVAYINGFVAAINKKYAKFSKRERIFVKGTGRNCNGLLAYARKLVETKRPETAVVWLMYDKDDFPYDNFDNTQYSAESGGQKNQKRVYKVAWSNESLELWFVLHFQELTVNVGRDKYIDLLEKHCGYEKNDPMLYQKMRPYTQIALQRAKKQYEAYPEGTPPSQRCPATRVFELVEELQQYL